MVMLTPEGETDHPVPVEPAVMDQFNTTFHPKMLVARAGQVVQFKNSEDTLHNVHVIDIETRETELNIATPVKGSFDHVFESPGVFDVSCGIHPSMAAFIVITETPFAAVADTDGSFSLDEVPPGRYRARVWNLDESRRSEQSLEILPGTTSVALGESDRP